MKKVLQMESVICLDMEPGETQEQAEARFLNILEGITILQYTASVKEKDDNTNENV